jgi:protein-S-isoprenylcysteine O-methyltransferase Ste14
MRAIDLFFGVAWIAFWVYWLISASRAKAGRTQWTRFAGFRVGMILVVLLLLRLGVLKGRSVIRDPVLWAIGLVLFVAGLGLAIWARVYLGRNWGMPMSTKDDPELVTSGPYRVIRHPIYTGLLLAMIGTTIAVSLYWLIAVVLLGGYFIYSAYVEERNMSKTFPGRYPQYKAGTKMLIPYIL